jgi:hypothetical protein
VSRVRPKNYTHSTRETRATILTVPAVPTPIDWVDKATYLLCGLDLVTGVRVKLSSNSGLLTCFPESEERELYEYMPAPKIVEQVRQRRRLDGKRVGWGDFGTRQLAGVFKSS